MEAWNIIVILKFKRNYFSEVYIMANYIVLGTWNTKYEELDFLCEEIRRRSHQTYTLRPLHEKNDRYQEYRNPSIHFRSEGQIKRNSKKEAHLRCHFSGGGNNLFMATKLMDDIPLFVPKISFNNDCQQYHNFKPYKDILYFQSPCDFGMLNPLTKSLLTNCVTIFNINRRVSRDPINPPSPSPALASPMDASRQ